jgi:1,2-diacylglycerol 3-beta-galactosyltransferase
VTGGVGPPVRLLFLIGDTGAGHRSAATAVAQALEQACPGGFDPVLCDPLRGPGAPRWLRWLIGLYGPTIRLAPWLWAVLWRMCSSPALLRWARRTVLSPAYRGVASAVAAWEPAAIVSFHPFTVDPAARVRELMVPSLPVITVVTDLVNAHRSWLDAAVDRVIVPSAVLAGRCAEDGMPDGHCVEIGLPVATAFVGEPASVAQRHALQRALGLRGRFLVVVTGGGEGSGGLYRRTLAILEHVGDVDVVVICGRNRRLRRRLGRLTERARGRLTVHGFVDNMADWLRCADVVVGKAGPGTIAEATCCGSPLLLTSSLPGQEQGNAALVVGAGAGLYAPGRRDLVTQIRRLRDEPAVLATMRQASARAGRPRAAADIATLIAEAAQRADGVPAAGRAGG